MAVPGKWWAFPDRVLRNAASLAIKSALRKAWKREHIWVAPFAWRRPACDPLSLRNCHWPTGGIQDVAQANAHERRGSRRRRIAQLPRRGPGYRQDRPDRADDRPASVNRQADRSGREALSAAAWHHGC